MGVDVNLLAVFLAAIVSVVIGVAWYAPSVFGRRWMAELGMSEQDLAKMKQKGMGKSYALGFFASLVMAYVLAYFVQLSGASLALEAVQLGFFLWLGFIATVMLGGILWEGKTWTLYLINAAYWLVSLVVMSSILVLWV